MVAGELGPVAAVALNDGSAGLRRVPAHRATSDPADARADRRRPRERARAAASWPHRMEARRRAAAGPPARRRGTCVHPEPRGHHRRGSPRSCRPCSRLPVECDRARRRGDRPRAGRQAPSVSAHDEPLRERERGGGPRGDTALAVLLRRAPRGRRGPDRPAARGAARGSLERACPPRTGCRGSSTETPAEAEAFLADALEHGHEGVMVKSLDAPYEAGRRGGAG